VTRRLPTICLLGLVGLLAVAGIMKLLDPDRAAISLVELFAERLGGSWAGYQALIRAVGACEVAVAIGLLISGPHRGWYVCTAGLVIMFVVLDCVRAISGAAADCGCFGMIVIPGGWIGIAAKDLLVVGLATGSRFFQGRLLRASWMG
jgi:methylamine utilization protein MauE